MSSDAESKPKVSATIVANKFVRDYYHTIRQAPKNAHRYYDEDSKFTRIEDGKQPSFVVGQQVWH